MSTLYSRIAALCEENGISGYRLCKDIGIQPSILSDLKSGRKKSISAEYANKIATYFNVSVSYLLGEENEKSPTGQEADEAKSIDYLLSKMTPAELAELMGKVAQELKERGLE